MEHTIEENQHLTSSTTGLNQPFGKIYCFRFKGMNNPKATAFLFKAKKNDYVHKVRSEANKQFIYVEVENQNVENFKKSFLDEL